MDELIKEQKALIILIPGFISIVVARSISHLYGIDSTDLFILYLSVSAINIGFSVFLFHLYGRYFKKIYKFNELIYNNAFLAFSFIFSILVGVIIAISYEHNILTRVSRGFFRILGSEYLISKIGPNDVLMGLSQTATNKEKFKEYDNRIDDKHTVEKIFKAYFKDKPDIVIGTAIRLNVVDGQTKQLYLSPACEKNASGWIPIEGPGVIINVEELYRIDIIDYTPVSCVVTQKQPIPDVSASNCQNHD